MVSTPVLLIVLLSTEDPAASLSRWLTYLEHRVYRKVLLHVGGEHHLDHLLSQGFLQGR